VGYAEGITMGQQLWLQLQGVLTTVIYGGIVSFIILKVVDAVIGLRVSDEQESQGLDITQHEERGYYFEGL
jgi:Amt family ammonium transporter